MCGVLRVVVNTGFTIYLKASFLKRLLITSFAFMYFPVGLGLKFGLSLKLHSYFVYGSNECSGEYVCF